MKKILLLIGLALILMACGARKREMERTETSLDIVTKKDTSAHTVQDVVLEERRASEAAVQQEERQEAVEVGEGGTAVIREYAANGSVKKETTITGNAKMSAGENKNVSGKKEVSVKKGTGHMEIVASGKSEATVKAKSDVKNVSVKRDGVNWFGLILPVGMLVFVLWIVIPVFRKKEGEKGDL